MQVGKLSSLEWLQRWVLGLKVYKAEIGSFPSSKQLVSIFDYGEDFEPVTLEVQEEFQRQWAQSMISK